MNWKLVGLETEIDSALDYCYGELFVDRSDGGGFGDGYGDSWGDGKSELDDTVLESNGDCDNDFFLPDHMNPGDDYGLGSELGGEIYGHPCGDGGKL